MLILTCTPCVMMTSPALYTLVVAPSNNRFHSSFDGNSSSSSSFWGCVDDCDDEADGVGDGVLRSAVKSFLEFQNFNSFVNDALCALASVGTGALEVFHMDDTMLWASSRSCWLSKTNWASGIN